MQENQGGDLRQSHSTESGESQATTGPLVMQEEGKTPRTEMVNNNIRSSHGVEALQNDMAAPIVNQADGGD